MKARSHRPRSRGLGHSRLSHDLRPRRPRELMRRARLADLGGIDPREHVLKHDDSLVQPSPTRHCLVQTRAYTMRPLRFPGC